MKTQILLVLVANILISTESFSFTDHLPLSIDMTDDAACVAFTGDSRCWGKKSTTPWLEKIKAVKGISYFSLESNKICYIANQKAGCIGNSRVRWP